MEPKTSATLMIESISKCHAVMQLLGENKLVRSGAKMLCYRFDSANPVQMSALRGCGSRVEHLPGTSEALDLVLSIVKRGRKKPEDDTVWHISSVLPCLGSKPLSHYTPAYLIHAT